MDEQREPVTVVWVTVGGAPPCALRVFDLDLSDEWILDGGVGADALTNRWRHEATDWDRVRNEFIKRLRNRAERNAAYRVTKERVNAAISPLLSEKLRSFESRREALVRERGLRRREAERRALADRLAELRGRKAAREAERRERAVAAERLSAERGREEEARRARAAEDERLALIRQWREEHGRARAEVGTQDAPFPIPLSRR